MQRKAGECGLFEVVDGFCGITRVFCPFAHLTSADRDRMANKRILLLEPAYKNKYPPLGLMKIAQYHGPLGQRDYVKFVKGANRQLSLEPWDRVYITTLFSFEFQRIAEAIDFAIEVVHGQTQRVFVGGIAASLMHERFLDEPRWRRVHGLLKACLTNHPPWHFN
jgi:hypothetical protein